MSYDLYFKTRGAPLDPQKVLDYFSARPNYSGDIKNVNYGNQETGVYFHFEYDDESGDLMFNMNYFRPSYFALEAEPEVAALVKEFDLTVVDNQTEGMGEGEYATERFLSGWNFGNDFAFRVILGKPDFSDTVSSLPSADLQEAWQWNFVRHLIQEKLGVDVFVPRVMFARVRGKPATLLVWPDGIPIAVTKVDYFCVVRDELAPRRFFLRKRDQILLPWERALPWLQKYMTVENGFQQLNYTQRPDDIRQFIAELPASSEEFEGVSPDEMFDAELVEKYLRRPQ